MPAKSEAQRRFLYATKGAAWVKEHDFDNKGKLPSHSASAATKAKIRTALKRLGGKKS